MGSVNDKISGYSNRAFGNLKQAVGRAAGSDRLRLDGQIQAAKGQAEIAIGIAKDAIRQNGARAAEYINRMF